MGDGTRARGTDDWIVEGQPIADTALRAEIDRTLSHLATGCGTAPPRAPGDAECFDKAERALDAALEHVGEEIASQEPSGARLRLLITYVTRVTRLQRRVGQAHLRHRSVRLGAVQESFGRLRDVATIDQILEAIPAEVLRLGFSRVILSRVRESMWEPEVVLVDGDPEWAARILQAARAEEQRMDHMLLETEMIRRRIPMIVTAVQVEPRTHRVIADTSLSRSYVAAPIMPEGRVIGFLHADCYMTSRHVDEFDRDVLWLFAEGAGYAFERTVLKERLRDLREQAARLTGVIGAVIDEAAGADIDLARLSRSEPAMEQGVRVLRAPSSPSGQIATLLTRRELEVAELMAAGATNGEIARRLVITEGTVKTHVSHILRKLRAANRAQAVSTYMRLTHAAPA